jgi:hypothetical protein
VTPKSLFVLEKSGGVTDIRNALQYDQIGNLYEAGDKLGWLWREGLFQGADPK